MIFVTVGTQPQLFTRLFDELVNLIDENIITDRIIAQAGSNIVTNPSIESFDFLPSKKMLEYLQEASLIISHGGTGSIISALKLGKKVIGIPRIAELGEHINNHQKDLIDTLSQENLILPVYDIKELKSKIIESTSFVPNKFLSGQEALISELKEYIKSC